MNALVVGAGPAGLAAAFHLARRRARVCIARTGLGAASLGSGAIDGAARGIAPERLAPLLDALGWVLPPGGALVATCSGVLRRAAGVCPGVLDLGGLGEGVVGVVDGGRADFPAAELVRAFQATRIAEGRGLRFEVVDGRALLDDSERAAPCIEVARGLDEEERLRRFGEGLAPLAGAHRALLLGPWGPLGRPGWEHLRAAVEVPVGEVLSPYGGVAGARFDASRDQVLQHEGVRTLPARVVRLCPDENGVTAAFDDREQRFDGAVLAVGGVASGGLVVSRGDWHGRGVELAVRAPLRVVLEGRDADLVTSAHGLPWDTLGLAALERVGVAARSDGRVTEASRLFVAGDVVAARPRTLLEAIRAGFAAADAMLADHVRSVDR